MPRTMSNLGLAGQPPRDPGSSKKSVSVRLKFGFSYQLFLLECSVWFRHARQRRASRGGRVAMARSRRGAAAAPSPSVGAVLRSPRAAFASRCGRRRDLDGNAAGWSPCALSPAERHSIPLDSPFTLAQRPPHVLLIRRRRFLAIRAPLLGRFVCRAR